MNRKGKLTKLAVFLILAPGGENAQFLTEPITDRSWGVKGKESWEVRQ